MLYVEDAIHELVKIGFTLNDAEAARKTVATQEPKFVHYRLLYLTKGGSVEKWHRVEKAFQQGFLRMHHAAIRHQRDHDTKTCPMCKAERDRLNECHNATLEKKQA